MLRGVAQQSTISLDSHMILQSDTRTHIKHLPSVTYINFTHVNNIRHVPGMHIMYYAQIQSQPGRKV